MPRSRYKTDHTVFVVEDERLADVPVRPPGLPRLRHGRPDAVAAVAVAGGEVADHGAGHAVQLRRPHVGRGPDRPVRPAGEHRAAGLPGDQVGGPEQGEGGRLVPAGDHGSVSARLLG